MIRYLASPYTHDSASVRGSRYRDTCFVAAALVRRGEIIYCPIASWHFIAGTFDLPHDADYWLKADLEFLRHCGRMYVLQLEGWEQSVGVMREIEFAESRNISIEYITLGDFNGN